MGRFWEGSRASYRHPSSRARYVGSDLKYSPCRAASGPAVHGEPVRGARCIVRSCWAALFLAALLACLPSIRGMTTNDDAIIPLIDRLLSIVLEQPSRRIVAAADCDMPPGLALTSVFDLPHAPLTLRNDKFVKTGRPRHYRVDRRDGVTRFRQVEERETAEFIKREENRRARQVVPRPPKSARASWSRYAG